jgi:hypothetical protein
MFFMKQHQSDRHQVMLLFDETRQQIGFPLCHTKQSPTSRAETLSIISSSFSPESDKLLEAGRTDAKFSEFNALRTRVLVPLGGGKSVFLPR